MKSIIVLVAALSAPVMVEDKCQSVSEYAKTVMDAHQTGVPMVTMMGIAKSELGKKVVVDAYSRPRFGTEGFKNREIAEFRDKWYLWCIQALS